MPLECAKPWATEKPCPPLTPGQKFDRGGFIGASSWKTLSSPAMSRRIVAPWRRCRSDFRKPRLLRRPGRGRAPARRGSQPRGCERERKEEREREKKTEEKRAAGYCVTSAEDSTGG